MLKVARWRSESGVPTNPNQRLVVVVVVAAAAAAVELAVVESLLLVVSAEKQDNIDGITHEVRRPLPHQLHVFAAH